MSTINDLKTQIDTKKITFDPPLATAERLKKEFVLLADHPLVIPVFSLPHIYWKPE